MSERIITHIVGARWVEKVGKYVVQLGFCGHPAETVWMTGKQLDQIESLFDRTPNGYSTKAQTVTGVWNEKGYYSYARIGRKPFEPPPQYNLDDLIEGDI